MIQSRVTRTRLAWSRFAANTRLLAFAHVDAFRTSPRAYLTAAKWWLLGKRLRARGQFEALLRQSHYAYELWLLFREGRLRQPAPEGQSPEILALVAADESSGKLGWTVQSAEAEGIAVAVIRNGDFSALTAHGLSAASQPLWVMPMRAGDLLSSGAAMRYRDAIKRSNSGLIYADDDLIDQRLLRSQPHFKADWNRELYRHHDYVTGACALRIDKQDIERVQGRSDWDRELVAIAVEREKQPQHIHEILHHRLFRPVPPERPRALEILPELPSVSIIIPTRNRLDLLRTVLDGVAATDYPNLEVIVVDNDSDDPETLAFLEAQDPSKVKVLRHPGPFNYSTINNRAVAEANGELICLLNNDIEVLSPNWLAIMATQAMRDDVGAVGALLLYPDGRIQHAGVLLGVVDAAVHPHQFLDPEAEGYFRRHALPQFASAVTAACLVVRRDRFLAVGGLDERNFAVAYNDVDLCLRLNQKGWQSFYEPRAVLVHHESVSRGFDQDPVGAARFARELAALKRIWKTDTMIDPFHHPSLSRHSAHFELAL